MLLQCIITFLVRCSLSADGFHAVGLRAIFSACGRSRGCMQRHGILRFKQMEAGKLVPCLILHDLSHSFCSG